MYSEGVAGAVELAGFAAADVAGTTTEGCFESHPAANRTAAAAMINSELRTMYLPG
jgi:hypothetical protein